MGKTTLLTVAEVADYLQLSPKTIYSWCQAGKIPAVKIGKQWRIDPVDLELFLDRADKSWESLMLLRETTVRSVGPRAPS